MHYTSHEFPYSYIFSLTHSLSTDKTVFLKWCHCPLFPGKNLNSLTSFMMSYHSYITHPNPRRKLTYFDPLLDTLLGISYLSCFCKCPSMPLLQSVEIHPSNSQMAPQRTSMMPDSFFPFSSFSSASYWFKLLLPYVEFSDSPYVTEFYIAISPNRLWLRGNI